KRRKTRKPPLFLLFADPSSFNAPSPFLSGDLAHPHTQILSINSGEQPMNAAAPLSPYPSANYLSFPNLLFSPSGPGETHKPRFSTPLFYGEILTTSLENSLS
ncbi:hypothetical protein HAX54_023383, partial [Datura stramonium]|nr:hypothetical protein [Datura stramonium]